ncbi:hypothetical protein D3C87_2003260 [compost metagenome]
MRDVARGSTWLGDAQGENSDQQEIVGLIKNKIRHSVTYAGWPIKGRTSLREQPRPPFF